MKRDTCGFYYIFVIKIIVNDKFKIVLFSLFSSLDVRGVSLTKGIHWSSPDIFGPRARFNIDADVPALEIEVI